MFAEPQQKNTPQQQSPVTVQPKLEVGDKDDAHEKEANEVAGKIMKMGEGETISAMGEDDENKKLKRMEDDDEGKVMKMHDEDEGKIMKTGDEEDEKVMRVDDDEEKVMKMSDGANGGSMTAPSHVESGIAQSKGGGQSLPDSVQKDIGGKMGADLGDVKIHTDSNAHQMSSDINAKAFTHGQDIYFKQGNYNTTSDSGKELLAHELVHTQQQKGGVQRRVQRQIKNEKKITPTKLPVINISNWALDTDSVAIYIKAGKDYFFVPAREVQIYKIPETKAGSGKTLKLGEPVAGMPAIGAGGSIITVGRTSNGSVVTMLDAGGRTGSAIYQEQLEGLMGRLGVSSIETIKILHNHKDHVNEIGTVVRLYGVRNENLRISPYFLYNSSIRKVLSDLATDPQTVHLGYSRQSAFEEYVPGSAGEVVTHLNFSKGSLVFNFYATSALVQSLSTKAKNYLNSGSSKGFSDTKLEDAASFIAEVSMATKGSFRMLVLGDLRGRDYTTLMEAMNRVKPNSFAKLFENTTLLAGFHHHLGVVEKVEDVIGIRAVLNVTVFKNAKLEVVVQTNAPQMRMALVDALRLLGVSVTVVGKGTVGEPSGAIMYSGNAVVPYGPAAQRFEAFEGSNRMTEEIMTMREKREIFEEYVRANPLKFSKKEVSEIREAFKYEVNRLTSLRNEFTDTVLNFKNLKNQTKRSSKYEGPPLELLHMLEKQNEKLTGGRNKSYSKTQLSEEVMSEGELMRSYNRNLKEFEASVNFAVKRGEITPGLMARLFEMDPALGKQLSGKSYEEIIGTSRRFIEEGRAGGPTSIGQASGRLRGAKAGILAALTVFTDIGLPYLEISQRNKKLALAKVYNEIQWWQSMGIVPKIKGVITHTFSGDEIISDHAKAVELASENKLDYLMIDDIDDAMFVAFMFWSYANINDLDDYSRHFLEPAVFRGGFNKEANEPGPVKAEGDYFENQKWAIKKYYYKTSGWNSLEYSLKYHPLFTKIMNALAQRVIIETQRKLDVSAKSKRFKQDVIPPQEQDNKKAFVSPNINLTNNPNLKLGPPKQYFLSQWQDPDLPQVTDKVKRKVKFKSDTKIWNKSCYNLDDKEPMIAGSEWWKDPVFYELEATNVPNGYIVVAGANFNSYSQIKGAWVWKKNTKPWITKFRYYTDHFFEMEEKLMKELGQEVYRKQADKNVLSYMEEILSSSTPNKFVEQSYGDVVGHYEFPGETFNTDGYALVKKSAVETVKE